MDHENGNRITEPVRSALYDQTLVLQRDFDQHHDLGGLAFSKTWGVASWGSYVAACITFHPGDMVEYIMPAGERCHIVFMKEDADEDLQENANFPWQEISATSVERNTQTVLQEILTKTEGQAVPETAIDHRILYNICCASLMLCESQYLYLVDNILRKLSISVEGGLEAELDLVQEVESSGSAADVNRESLDEYIVVDTVPEAMDVDETGDGNMMGEELDTLEDSAFANTLFAMFDVCPYCQSKYVG
ncbi:MAG: hypothetical protein Q9228_005747 [Teloschistes exilis]